MKIQDKPVINAWPMFRQDPTHRGYSTSKVPTKVKPAWIYKTEDSIRSSPAIANGKVFIGSNDGCVYALRENATNPNGELLWKYRTVGKVVASPAVARGRVFVSSMDGYVYALKENPQNPPEGELIWKYFLGEISKFTSSPVVSGDKVFVGSESGYLYCLKAMTDNPKGELLWKHQTEGWHHGSPAVADGKVFIGNSGPMPPSGYHVFCLKEKTGELIWKYRVGDKPWGIGPSPAVTNGRVFISADDGCLYALKEDTENPNGELIWKYEGLGGMFSSAAIAYGRVFVGLEAGKGILALDENTGEPVWRWPTKEKVRSSPAVADGKVVIGDEGTGLYALNALTANPKGELIWYYKIDQGIFSSPAIANGMIFVGSKAGYVHALKATAPSEKT
jgi:outer membrane protein assembly factor BamB